MRPAVIVLTVGGLDVARRAAEALGGTVHARRPLAAEESFSETIPHLQALFREGQPIVGICAAGILVRALAPLLSDKRDEPPVLAVSEDGASVVPMLGGHRGANDLARRLAESLRGHAAVTTAGDARFGIALDAPPGGWVLANPQDAKSVMATLLSGASAILEGEADWLRESGLPFEPLPFPSWGRRAAPVGAAEPSSRSLAGSERGVVREADGTTHWVVPNDERREPERAAGQAGGGVTQAPRHENTPTPALPHKGEGSDAASSPRSHVRLLATTRREPGDARTLVYHPRRLAIGIGCERGADEAEVRNLVSETLSAANLAPQAVALVASLDLKTDEAAVLAAGTSLGVPTRFFSVSRLEAETPRLANPSDAVFREVGCHGVAEAAALAAAGESARLVVPKQKSARATCAVAEAPDIIDPAHVGRARGRLAVVGIGPGSAEWLTPQARRLLEESDILVGYSAYLDLIAPLIAGKRRVDSDLGREEERARQALVLAGEGQRVALVSSGDAGIYAMASLVFECLDSGDLPDGAMRAEVIVAPGISALQAAAARAGAPLGHDFCAISLSDLLTPWEAIERRIHAAAAADFVIAFYNPVSRRRRTGLAIARDILLQHRPADTPVVLARNLGREGERVTTLRLHDLDVDMVDMLTLVLVGASSTRTVKAAGRAFVYTPRGYGVARSSEDAA